MLLFLLKRLAFFIPTLLVISIIVFGLSKQTAGDPVLNKLPDGEESNASNILSDELYLETAKELGLDKPNFYFSITSQAFPKDAHKIVKKEERTALENLTKKYGNWKKILAFHQKVKAILLKLSMPDTLGFNNELQQLLIQDDGERINYLLGELHKKSVETTVFKEDFSQLKQAYQNILDNPTRGVLFLPTFYWYGFDNQYHNWVSDFLIGNFGIAKNGQTVAQKISTPLSITLFMSIPTIVLAYLIGVPLGIFSAAKKQKRSGKWLMKIIFALYSLPTFWIAVMAIRFLTTPEYGIKVFPSAGLSDLNTEFSISQYIKQNISKFILPILCMMVHPIAYISRLTQGAIVDNFSLDYVRTARAKGLAQTQILRHHVLKNALFPLITLIGTMLPLLISGSFVVEFVFNIKGMGVVAMDAIAERDWQVVYTVLMFSAIMVLLGTLVSDILYKWANPRVVV
jgi:peptide/nickel transport system permease protein